MYALVTYERGHIYKQDVVLLTGNSTIYKLPITSDMAPIAYVSVVVVSGADNTQDARFQDRHGAHQRGYQPADAGCEGHNR